MKTKVEFYKEFFVELEKKDFGVEQPSSPDYVADIQFKSRTIAFYTKADRIHKTAISLVQRQYFYNKEEAFESFVARSGLIDARKLFAETQMRLIHAGLVKLRTMDEGLSAEDMEEAGELVNRLEEIVPELHGEERKFDVMRLLNALSPER